MVLEILCVEPIYPLYSEVLETCLALRCWFFECLAAKVLRRHVIKEGLDLGGGGLVFTIY